MKDEMKLFKENAAQRNLCSPFALDWSRCKTQQSLIDFCMLQGSIPYFATAVYEGWGLSLSYLTTEFKDFINDKYLIENIGDIEGCTGRMYVEYDSDPISISESVIHIISCKNDNINVAGFRCPQIHVSNKSDITISCDGHSVVMIYLYDSSSVNLKNIPIDCTISVYRYSEDGIISMDNVNGKVRVKERDIKIDAFGYGIYNI